MRPIRSSASPTRTHTRRLLLGTLHRAGALLGLLLVLPVLVAIALAVRTTSPGPVLSRQERVGGNGRVVGLLRFRPDDGERPGSPDPVVRALRGDAAQ